MRAETSGVSSSAASGSVALSFTIALTNVDSLMGSNWYAAVMKPEPDRSAAARLLSAGAMRARSARAEPALAVTRVSLLKASGWRSMSHCTSSSCPRTPSIPLE